MDYTTEPHIFNVTQLNQSAQKILTTQMGSVWISGEVSNFVRPASGYWYFTLKDERSQVRCVCFNRSQLATAPPPRNGSQVLIHASVTMYIPRGDYQLIVEQLQPIGEGLLQLRFEECKRRLISEGLFELRYKKPLPSKVTRVGIITSPSGAVLHDVLQILERRDPSLGVVIYPSAVQGEQATAQLVLAVNLANQRKECQVLILARGGGTLEDLWCFNEEQLARAIFGSRIPIISAVGHETDVTIADFVADLRAPTPSAAAELVSRDRQELATQLKLQQQQLSMAMDRYLANGAQRHEQILYSLLRRQPQLWEAKQQISQLRHRLQSSITKILHLAWQQFSVACARLEGISPLATLARGFSITSHPDGRVVHSIDAVAIGQTLCTRVVDGTMQSRVTSTTPTNVKDGCQ